MDRIKIYYKLKSNKQADTYAIRDIQKGEELSKYYGLPYWYKFELQNKTKIQKPIKCY